jgi:hypothetical protein
MTKYLRISLIYILGSPSSYMTLQPIPSEFPFTVYEETFFFIIAARKLIEEGMHLECLLRAWES